MNHAPVDILSKLREVRANAYAPYSNYKVAALIETPEGERFAGCNVEAAHYKSVCAEASAISAMIAAGQTRIRRAWILGGDDSPCPPCGDCRQRLFEFANEDTEVVLVDSHGVIHRRDLIDELLPGGFTLSLENRT